MLPFTTAASLYFFSFFNNNMSNWIIPFLAGVFVGQEFKEAPKVRPYIESGVRKIIEVSKDILNNAQTHTHSNDTNENNGNGSNTRRSSWWTKRDDKLDD